MAEEKQTEVAVVETVPAVMEFRLINPTEAGFLDHIEWNREELEAAVKAKVAEYAGTAYTEETLKSAKSDRAELNNLLKKIEERRKKVKEIINKPYADFEKELKEVTILISEQVQEITSQIDEFEEKQKNEKRQKIRDAYDEVIGELAEILPFEKVFDQRYLNKTYKLNSAVAEVKQKVEKVKTDLETIDSVCGKYKLNAKDVYVRTMDLSKALAEEKRLKELEEKMEADRIRKEQEAEERRKAEEARKAEEERKRQEAERLAAEAEQNAARTDQETEKAEQGAVETEQQEELPFDVPGAAGEFPDEAGTVPSSPMGRVIDGIQREAFAQATQTDTVVDPFAPKTANQPKARVKFYAIGTKDQLKGLVEYMKENNIKYGKVE